MSIEAMKQALEALISSTGELRLRLASPTDAQLIKNETAITALRAAIAEASMQRLTDVQQEMEREPVAWIDEHGNIDRGWDAALQPNGWQPIYTHPPRREWVGLTDEEIFKCVGLEKLDALRYLEAKLKEKNT